MSWKNIRLYQISPAGWQWQMLPAYDHERIVLIIFLAQGLTTTGTTGVPCPKLQTCRYLWKLWYCNICFETDWPTDKMTSRVTDWLTNQLTEWLTEPILEMISRHISVTQYSPSSRPLIRSSPPHTPSPRSSKLIPRRRKISGDGHQLQRLQTVGLEPALRGFLVDIDISLPRQENNF